MTEDLTQYTKEELSLRVFNEECLYLQRHHIGFIKILYEYYKFTQEQRKVLIEDLKADLNEINKPLLRK